MLQYSVTGRKCCTKFLEAAGTKKIRGTDGKGVKRGGKA